MNKTDVIAKVSETSGIDAATCDRLIKAFEEQTSETFKGKITGIVTSQGGIVAGVAEKTGVPEEDCRKVLSALEAVVKAGVFEKLKGLFSR